MTDSARRYAALDVSRVQDASGQCWVEASLRTAPIVVGVKIAPDVATTREDAQEIVNELRADLARVLRMIANDVERHMPAAAGDA